MRFICACLESVSKLQRGKHTPNEANRMRSWTFCEVPFCEVDRKILQVEDKQIWCPFYILCWLWFWRESKKEIWSLFLRTYSAFPFISSTHLFSCPSPCAPKGHPQIFKLCTYWKHDKRNRITTAAICAFTRTSVEKTLLWIQLFFYEFIIMPLPC